MYWLLLALFRLVATDVDAAEDESVVLAAVLVVRDADVLRLVVVVVEMIVVSLLDGAALAAVLALDI